MSRKEIEDTTGEIQEDLKYSKKQLHDQILLRPDTYIGSVRKNQTSDSVWVWGRQEGEVQGKFKRSKVTYAKGAERLFIEIMSNAIDNIWRSQEFKILCRKIEVWIDKQECKFTIKNDGKCIPVKKYVDDNGAEYEDYIPEYIFGELLTSSNYDDTEERKTSGRNGYGCKLTNIFSTEFAIDVADHRNKKRYIRKWTKNMYDKGEAIITAYKEPLGYTKVEWIPDLARFGMECLDDDYMSVIEAYIMHSAMIASLYGVKMYYNDELIKISNLEDYTNLYYTEPPTERLIIKSDDCKVVLCPRGEYTHISFVNGINTVDGGIHVDAWTEALFRPIVTKFNEKRESGSRITIADVKKHFMLFVIADLDKPEFENQSKNKLTSPPVTLNIKPSYIKKLLKWKFMESLEDDLKLKEMKSLEKEAKKKKGVIEGLMDANNAGTAKYGKDCILIITEGLSASRYAVQGMEIGVGGKVGHDWIGVFPIRGKFLNARKATVAQLKKNKEALNLISALGLHFDVDYSREENYKKLRYGILDVIGDADLDGLHIIGLMYNFFDTLFPSLLHKPGFFRIERIPIVKVSVKGEKLAFIYYLEAKNYIQMHKPDRNKVEYFKGLGSADKNDVNEDFGKYPVIFSATSSSRDLLRKIFNEDANFRKEWITNYEPAERIRMIPDYQVEEVDIGDFINEDLVLYSIDSCKRSLPCVLDGLKESHRKILYSAFKRNLTKLIKTAQFAGYVGENSAYHHGEQNLHDTITKMAQRFVGSNNIPIFHEKGNFGSRLEWGHDAAAARYTHMCLETISRLIFRREDFEYLEDREEDGQVIEKKFYMPIVPMIAVNGTMCGIGTGWSTNIPAYNLLPVIEWLLIYIENGGNVKETLDNGVVIYNTPDLLPNYRNFTGTISQDGHRITTSGKFQKVEGKENVYEITEIPIGKTFMSINKYYEFLKELETKKHIIKVDRYGTDEIPNFVIKVDPDCFTPTHKTLKLEDILYTSNMVLFDENEKIRKFESMEEILEYFSTRRYNLYIKRRDGDIGKIKELLKYILNKVRYIDEVCEGKLDIKDREEKDLIKEMIQKGYDMKENNRKKKRKTTEEDEDDDASLVETNIKELEREEREMAGGGEDIKDGEKSGKDEKKVDDNNDKSYDYLLNMTNRSLNRKSNAYQKLIKERNKLLAKLVELENITAWGLWKKELLELREYYGKWLVHADDNARGSAKERKKHAKARALALAGKKK